MSDGELSQDEIEQLLKGASADDSEKDLTKHKPVLSQGAVDELLKAIITGAPVKTEVLESLGERLAISKKASKSKDTPILSQDEIEELLKAISADDP